MNKQVPHLRGKGKEEHAKEIRNNTFWTVIAISFLLNILLVATAIVFRMHFPSGIIVAVCLLAGSNMAFQIFNYLICLLRTDKHFKTLSISNILFSFASLGCVLLYFGLFSNKLYGPLYGLLIGYTVSSVYIFYKSKYTIRFTVNRQLTVNTFGVGAPLIVIQVGAILISSIDRWMVAGMIGQIDLGYYGIGITMANFLFASASSVAFTLFPFMLEKFGQTQDEQQSESLVYTPILVLSYIMAVTCTFAALITPIIIKYGLPEFLPGLNCAIILVLGIYFISIMTICTNFLASIDKQNLVLRVQLCVLPLSALLNFIFIVSGYGIVGVAYATASIYFLYSTIIITLALRSFEVKTSKLLMKLNRIYFPFFTCIVVYYFLTKMIHLPLSSFRKDMFASSIQVAVFSVIVVALGVHLNRMTGVVQIFFDKFGGYLLLSKGKK